LADTIEGVVKRAQGSGSAGRDPRLPPAAPPVPHLPSAFERHPL